MHTASALYLRLCIHLWLSCYLSPYGAEGLLRNDEGSLATGRDPAGAELRLTFTPIQTSTQIFQERSTDAAEIANRRETRGVQATCQSTTVEKVKLWMPLTVAMLFIRQIGPSMCGDGRLVLRPGYMPRQRNHPLQTWHSLSTVIKNIVQVKGIPAA